RRHTRSKRDWSSDVCSSDLNACRYTESGRILLGVRRRGENVRLEVWDTGVGIALEQQEKIFLEFNQLANSHASGRKGVGLGLARSEERRVGKESIARGEWGK